MPDWFTLGNVGAVASIGGAAASIAFPIAALVIRPMVGRVLLAVQCRSLVDELSELQVDVRHLGSALEGRNVERARWLAADLSAALGVVLGRRSALLPSGDRTDLLLAQRLAKSILVKLREAAVVDDVAAARLLRTNDRCAELLATVLGHAQARVDANVGEATP